MRVFIAIPLPSEIRKQLAQVQSQLKNLDARVTWVNPAILHITLEFLGDVEEQKLAKILAAIKKGCQGVKSFELKLGHLGLIPNSHHPRVIAVFIGSEFNFLQRLKDQIRAGLETLGFRFEQEKSPHITLGRIKGRFSPRAKERFSQIAQTRNFTSLKRVKVGKIVLMQSTLTQVGPTYTPIAEIPLT